MNIVNEVFEEIEVDDIEEMGGESDRYLMTVIALVIAVRTSQKLMKKL